MSTHPSIEQQQEADQRTTTPKDHRKRHGRKEQDPSSKVPEFTQKGNATGEEWGSSDRGEERERSI
jgi:hypothetical protein